MPNICATCTNTTEEPYTICEHCEIKLTLTLLHIYTMIQPLRLLVDASVHVGDNTHHHGSDIAPTPVRLPILDLLDYTDSTIRELYIRLNPPPATGERHQPYRTDVCDVILDILAEPRLVQLPDIAIHASVITRLAQRMANTLNENEHKQPIGHCLNQLCGVTLYATEQDKQVTCTTCGNVQQVSDVRLAFWKQCLASDKLVTTSQATQLLNLCGIRLQAATIRQWAHRGKLHQADGYYHLNDISHLARTDQDLTKI